MKISSYILETLYKFAKTVCQLKNKSSKILKYKIQYTTRYM